MKTTTRVASILAFTALSMGCPSTPEMTDAGRDGGTPTDTGTSDGGITDGGVTDGGGPRDVPATPDTGCAVTQYRDSAGTCTDLTMCDATQFESTAATATSDRICTDLTECGGTQYESSPATATTDRVCTDLTVCEATQYESAPATATSDRECTDVTVCSATQYEASPPTPTSDRVCYAFNDCLREVQAGVAPTSPRITDACSAGEMASAIAVLSEGRGYVYDVRIGCSTVTATAVGPVRWPSGTPSGGFVTYQCGAGMIVSGLTANTGDVFDALGVECHVPNWGNDVAPIGLGLPATGTNVYACPAGNGLVAVSTESTNYFGADSVTQLDFVCGGAPGETTLVRTAAVDAPGTELTAFCDPGEVAIGIGVGVEGRGYVESFVVECAPLNGDRTGYGASHTVGALSGTPNMATCPAGQQLVGIEVGGGDVIDHLGAICRPIDWDATSASSTLGPWSPGATTPSVCPGGQVITGLSGRTVVYFGGDSATAVLATCAPLACP